MTERWHPDEPLPVIARFEVRRRAYLAPDGSINRQLPAFASDTRLLVRLYRAMVLVRAFDVKAVALQRTGRLGTYAASLGQEAVSVGTASAMHGEDVLLPSYRDNAALIWRGVELEEILLFWGGDERGNCFSGPVQDFPFCIPVGSQAPHAAGVLARDVVVAVARGQRHVLPETMVHLEEDVARIVAGVEQPGGNARTPIADGVEARVDGGNIVRPDGDHARRRQPRLLHVGEQERPVAA